MARRLAAPALTIVLLVGAGAGWRGPAEGADPPAPGAVKPAARAATPAPVAAFAPRFAHLPLAPPLALNGGFGEYRSNHFHAGLDLGTGGEVGRPVIAPLGGWVERVRASGAGYGRSIYLHAADGRLLVFAHLDAYAEPLASYVAAAQESTGQYEVDLWPEAGRFPIAAGQRIAWTGQSGAGGPHLHVEVRRGDMAYHPLRAGIAIPDTSAPTLVAVTFEPLDDTSYVERKASPVTVPLGARPATVTVLGRVRAVVEARDGIWRGVDRMVPWSVAMSFDGLEVECRFDSVSWASDMSESDHIYDSGRVTGGRGMVMWAPAGFRPRVMRASGPESEDAGTLVVRPGDPPRTLRLVARDLAGNTRERSLVLQPPDAGSAGAGRPDTSRAGGRAEADPRRAFAVATLPGHVRITYRGASAGSRGVTIGGRPASLENGAWSAVVAFPRASRPAAAPVRIPIVGRDAAGRPWVASFDAALRPDPSTRSPEDRGTIEWLLPRGALFEPAPVLFRRAQMSPVAPAELSVRSEVLELLPGNLRLRRPIRLEWSAASEPGIGLFGDDGEGWSWIGSPLDSASGRRVGETRHFGAFALFADTVAPRLTPLRPPSRAHKGAYSRWALETRVREAGSGIDSRGVWFEVDGRKVAVEWDGEKDVLRWRPHRAPAAGTHRFTVVARDRAGNERRATGRFVLR